MSALVRPLLEVLGPGEQVPELTVPAPDPLRLTASLSPPFQATAKSLAALGIGKQFLCVQGPNHPLSTLQGREPGVLACRLNFITRSVYYNN